MHTHLIPHPARLAESIRGLAKERKLSLSDAIDLHLRSASRGLCENERREARSQLISVLALNMPQGAAA